MDCLNCDYYDLPLLQLCEDMEREDNEDLQLYDVCQKLSQHHNEISPQVRSALERPATTSEVEELPLTDMYGPSTSKDVTTRRVSVTNVSADDMELINVQIIEGTFWKKFVTYRILHGNGQALRTPQLFLHDIKDRIIKLIEQSLIEQPTVNINLILKADFTQETNQQNKTFDFQLRNYVVSTEDDKNTIFSLLTNDILNKLSDFEINDNGWNLVKINHMDMNVNKPNPLPRSLYLDLPLDIKHKKAVINVQNKDHECFRWAVLSGLFEPLNKSSNRVSSYMVHRNKLKFGNLPFPIKINDIHIFENMNDISINVFGLEYNFESKKHIVVGPLHFTKCRKPKHLNLLYITEGNKGHYCFIKNLSRLVSSQLSRSEHAVHICDGCLAYFTLHDSLIKHQENDCLSVCTNFDFKRRRPGLPSYWSSF